MRPNLSLFLTKILLLMNMFQRIDQRAGHLINLIVHGIASLNRFPCGQAQGFRNQVNRDFIAGPVDAVDRQAAAIQSNKAF